MAEEVQKSTDSQPCKKCRSFFGTVQTNFLCSVCFAESQDKQHPTSTETPIVPEVPNIREEVKEEQPAPVSRCYKCERKLSLVPFKCKCEHSFCSRHRLPEEHECGFDYKAEALVRLSKSNPVVIAEKVNKI